MVERKDANQTAAGAIRAIRRDSAGTDAEPRIRSCCEAEGKKTEMAGAYTAAAGQSAEW